MMVLRGLGVSVMDPLAFRALGPPGVVALPFDPPLFFECYSLHARDRIDQAMAQAFLASIKSVLSAM
ncbi:hypothetical protein GmRootV213_60230 (plasmid) [Variovorax sp. V213]